MRLLDRYLLRELLVPLAYCLSGFIIFWISFDLFSELDRFHERGLSAVDITRYYLVKTPETLVEVIPIALLLALLYSLTSHARHNELIAIRTAGVSLWRLCLPYLGVGLLFSLVLFALNELWVPGSIEQTRAMLHRQESPESLRPGRWQFNLNFRNARDQRIWNIGAFNLDTYELINPQINWEMPDHTRRSLIATNGIWTNRCWTFLGVQEFIYPAVAGNTNSNSDPDLPFTSTNTPALSVPEFSETPEQIKGEIKINRLTGVKAAREAQLSIGEITSYLRLHPDLNPVRRALLFTQLHARLAYPWTCLVVVLIALPFGAPSGRRNAFVGVASSIFICFTFFVLFKFGLALGTGRYLPSWLAAWLPNALFASAGIWLTTRVR
jgi:lipopolysaccharide export system permease protein